ncbi:MAG: ATP-binding cassette domain-containing protein [Spirochaetaceae bacterium]|jgi:putative ABC transport system ATP-binding protein|nr:ATP-binding cassette domain-containing protein [Spirochaetaceae bacterium]
MIGLNDIEMVFGQGTSDENHVLNNLSLKINKGDFITIIGSNGAGKSTLFNVISGKYSPSFGQVFFNGADVTPFAEYKRAKWVGRIFQDPLLGTAGNMSLEHNMVITHKKGFKGLRVSLNRENREFFKKELVQLDMNLENRLKDNVGNLSGGQRQALTLLMTVLSRPELLLLDEHTAALDPKNASKVLELTDKFISQYKLTAMMVTHNMQQAIDYGNRLLMLDGGEVIFDVSGEMKKNLTVEALVKKFHEIRKTSFKSDEALLT